MKNLKNNLALGLAIIFSLGLVGFYKYNQTTEKAISGKVDYTFTSSQLLKQYAEQTSLSDSLYLDKTVSVEGTIKSITPVKKGINVELNTGEEMETVTGTIDSTQIPEGIVMTEGKNIKLKGRCAGYVEEEMLGLKNVSIVQCSISLN